VLQAMVLTDGPRMLCTPTYHVFEMYKIHQDAALLPVWTDGEDCGGAGGKLPKVHGSASRDKAGKVHVSLVNLHPEEAAEVACEARGVSVARATGRVLTGAAMNAHNTFDNPDEVHPVSFGDAQMGKTGLTVELPARSVTVLELT
jgi:alpha-N-arabinofuranosidase